MAKQRWNKAHYSEVKASLGKELVNQFKTKCRDNNVSIASVLSGFMSEYCNMPSRNKGRSKSSPFDTRPKRRRMVTIMAGQLDEILQCEIAYRENIPENLQSSVRAECADDSIEKLTEALDILNDAY
jgi:hypothetical protein